MALEEVMGTSTGLDMITHNKPLQGHWFRRLIAYVIDYVIVIVVLSIWFAMSPFYSIFAGFWLASLLQGAVVFIYCGVTEGMMGATLGKRFMKLQVVSLRGPLTMDRTMIRNASKLHGALLLIDILLGLVSTGDPRQRFLDRFVDTTVVEAGALGEPFQSKIDKF